MTTRFSFLMIQFSFLLEREIISIYDLISRKIKKLQRPTRQRQFAVLWYLGTVCATLVLISRGIGFDSSFCYTTQRERQPFFHWQGILGLAHLSYKSKRPKRDPEKGRTFLTIKCLQDFAIETSEVTGPVHIRSSPAWPPNIIFQFS